MKLTDDLPPRWILIKGALFAAVLILSALLVVLENRAWARAALLFPLVWSTARFYYFLFYALEHYVDPDCRISGVGSALQFLRRKSKRR